MSEFRPSAKISLDGREFTAPEAGLVWLRVDLAPGCHDAVSLSLWPGSSLASAAPGATLAIALGELDSEEDVLTGEVTAVRSTASGVTIEGLGATIELSRTYKTDSFVRQKVSDIANELAGSVTIDTIDSDLELAIYSVEDRRSAWSYLCDLAALAGADVGASPSGALRFVPAASAGASHTFRYGADLLAWNLASKTAPEAPSVAAHGAGSEAGAEKWHWPLNDPVGESPSAPTRIIGAVATREAADAAAQALADRAARAAVRGTVTVLGAAAVRPGDEIDIEDLPDGGFGTLRVARVTHTLDGARGFVSSLAVEASGGGPGLGF